MNTNEVTLKETSRAEDKRAHEVAPHQGITQLTSKELEQVAGGGLWHDYWKEFGDAYGYPQEPEKLERGVTVDRHLDMTIGIWR